MQPHLLAIIEQRTAGHLPIDDWGPTCAGCGADEFRLDGYCSLECRDFHSDEGIEELGDALVKTEIRAEAAEDDLRATEKLATDERERRIAAEEERDELRKLVIEAYPGDCPTNGWRKRAEDLDAWPGAFGEGGQP